MGKNSNFNSAQINSVEKRITGIMPEANDSIPTLELEWATGITQEESLV